ncbi:mannonate dehydratase [Xylophilus sp. Kf1]|nr:mannonate dehydratase [Xylophilus sp. Kf1]
MYLSEQLLHPDERRLRLCTQFGVDHVLVDLHEPDPAAARVPRDAGHLRAYRQWIESFGLTLDALTLDVGSVLMDSLGDLPSARRQRDRLADQIRQAGEAGIECLRYRLPLSDGLLTAHRPGRGGVSCSSFVQAEALADAPGVAPSVTAESAWSAIEFLVEGLLAAADQAGVRLACMPQSPPFPAAGRHGIEQVMGSAEGMRRFLALSPSRHHGLDFCQATVSAMFAEPAKALIPVIEEFASTGRIFVVRFNNIRGGYLDFQEVFPDEGDVDMFQALKAYQRGGYAGPICAEPSPVSDLDPDHQRFDAFALGYARGLLQAAGVWAAPGSRP